MNIPSHDTHLLYHIKTAHFWLDIALLALVWWATHWVDPTVRLLNLMPIVLIIKLVALIASLDVFSFFALHGLGAKRGLLAQGFMGGFISSTAVFVQLTQKTINTAVSSRRLAQTLLLACCAMLLECVFIVYTFAPQQFFAYGWPIAFTFMCIVFTIGCIPKSPQESTQTLVLENLLTHPIAWTRVIKFSMIIIGVMWLIRFLNDYLHLPTLWSTLLLSLFESHAVLAAVLINLNEKQQTMEGVYSALGLWLVLMVLLGNTISKSVLVLKTGNRKLSVYVLSPLILSACIIGVIAIIK